MSSSRSVVIGATLAATLMAACSSTERPRSGAAVDPLVRQVLSAKEFRVTIRDPGTITAFAAGDAGVSRSTITSGGCVIEIVTDGADEYVATTRGGPYVKRTSQTAVGVNREFAVVGATWLRTETPIGGSAQVKSVRLPKASNSVYSRAQVDGDLPEPGVLRVRVRHRGRVFETFRYSDIGAVGKIPIPTNIQSGDLTDLPSGGAPPRCHVLGTPP